MRTSIVIPTLNEERWLPAAVASAREGARGGGASEIVVADCGSADRTAEVARALGCRVVVDPALDSRGAAADAGGQEAEGDVLLFLDADCGLPEGWDLAVAEALADPAVVGGGFELRFGEAGGDGAGRDGPGWRLRLIEVVDRIRYRWSRLFYGDQGLFVRAEAWHRVGGFRGARILESAQLCRRLKRLGRLALVPLPVTASARRFEDGGVLRIFALDIALWLAGLLRLPIDRLAGRLYWSENRRR